MVCNCPECRTPHVYLSMSTKHTTTFAFPFTPSRIDAALNAMRQRREQRVHAFGCPRMKAHAQSDAHRTFQANAEQWVADMLVIPPATRLADQLWFWIEMRCNDDHSDLVDLGMPDAVLRDCVARENRLTWCMCESLMHLLCDRVQEAFGCASRFGEAGAPIPDSLDLNDPMWADVEITV